MHCKWLLQNSIANEITNLHWQLVPLNHGDGLWVCVGAAVASSDGQLWGRGAEDSIHLCSNPLALCLCVCITGTIITFGIRDDGPVD